MQGSLRANRVQVAIFFVTVLGLGFFFTVQVRSQATADQLLSGQDNVTLGLLITGLAQSNERLVQARSDLSAQEGQLAASATSPNSARQQLSRQVSELQVINGTTPVRGPGVELKIGFTMQTFELQDLANAMRQLGAEALSMNQVRLTAKSVIGEKSGALTVDGETLAAPYDLRAVGDPAQLSAGAAQLLTQLKSRGSVSLDQQADIHITAVVVERPQVYSYFGQ
ncbi:MAG TPA: DUF881 domain-containing protein [Candidatus Solibacter sp.]|nr:DUF881 domain-containing protein [Candidatus Solibacter sp.]